MTSIAMARTAMAKQDTVNIRTHMPMVPTTSKGMVARQRTKTRRNTSSGHLRVICCREMNNDSKTAGGTPMVLVVIIPVATPYRPLRVLLCVVVRIVLSCLHSPLPPSLSNRSQRCIVPPVPQTKDISMLISDWPYTSQRSQHKRHGPQLAL